MTKNNRTDNRSRAEVLALLAGNRNPRLPCFSGLINVTAPGLESIGLKLCEVHVDPDMMARAAATTYRLFGFESAVVPLDMCVEAEILGARVDFRLEARHPELPRVIAPLVDSPNELEIKALTELTKRARVSVVTEAIRILKADVGKEIVVGAWVPGPFTLATQLVDLTNLVMGTQTAAEDVGRVLDQLTDVLLEVAVAYHLAGADFLTVHEMGGSPGFIGPPTFGELVLPRLRRMLQALPAPRVLSVCGNTNRSMALLAEAGADALHVDQTNDLAQSREVLGPETILFGNIDPVKTLVEDDDPSIRSAVTNAIEARVDAIWPGCDLWPRVPAANMRLMIDESQRSLRCADRRR